MISSDECVKYRLEALKMAYEFNFKIGNIKTSYESEQEVLKDLQNVFAIAHINCEYIINGIFPSQDEDSENEFVSQD